MREDIRAEWVADLRNPALRQGKGALTIIRGGTQREDCCLGRLCEIAVKHRIILAPREFSGSRDRLVDMGVDGAVADWLEDDDKVMIYHSESGGLLPDLVEEWAQIDHNFTQILAAANDAGTSFAEIADKIVAEA